MNEHSDSRIRQLYALTVLVELMLMALFAALGGNPAIYPAADSGQLLLIRAGFVFAALVAMTLPVLLLQIRQTSKTPFDNSSRLGMLFLGAYAVTNTVVYLSQAVALPRLYAHHPELAQMLWFGDPGRFVYSIDLLGYTFFGIGAVLLGVPLCRDGGRRRTLGGLLVVSGLLSVLCYLAWGIGLDAVASVLTTVSGVLLLAVLVIAMRRDLQKGQP
jgi:hypothetical protein